MNPKEKAKAKAPAPQIHIYCTEELRTMIEELAIANDRTVTAQVRVLIATAHAEFVEQSKNNLKR